eukprot:6436614-Pyramimonas_sp.AAC.1
MALGSRCVLVSTGASRSRAPVLASKYDAISLLSSSYVFRRLWLRRTCSSSSAGSRLSKADMRT